MEREQIGRCRRVVVAATGLGMILAVSGFGCSRASDPAITTGGAGAPGSTGEPSASVSTSPATSRPVLKTSVPPNVQAESQAFCQATATANDAGFALGHKDPTDSGYQDWLVRFIESARSNLSRMAEVAPPDIADEARTLRDMFRRADVAELVGNPTEDASSAEERLRSWVRRNCGFAWGIEGGDSSRSPGSSTPSSGTPKRTVPPSTR